MTRQPIARQPANETSAPGVVDLAERLSLITEDSVAQSGGPPQRLPDQASQNPR